MSSIKFTAGQQSAVDVDGGNILVAAAAGSGKTAVLTQRVIRLLTKKDPVMANKLIIVTFTTAAACEMRQRINKKLSDIIDKDPTNELLQTQQLLLSQAKISTIHSLCSSLIRENFQVLGLTPDFKIADSSELTVIQNDAVDEVFDEYYQTNSIDFLDLVEFCCYRDDKALADMVLSIYDFIRSFPFPLDFLAESLKSYENNTDLINTKWYEYIKSHSLFALKKAEQTLIQALEQAQLDELVCQKYSPALQNDLAQVKTVIKLLCDDEWDNCVNMLSNFDKARLAAIRGYDDPAFLDSIKNLRSLAHTIIDDLKKKYITITKDEYIKDNEVLYPHIKLIFEIVIKVYQRIDQKKSERNVIDYGDLEHFALKLLVDHENGENTKTQIAKNLSEEFYEIMIDECQDINEVQNLIFKMLSKNETNIFMVGDVKQSIYRFRKAMPQIFVNKKNTFDYYSRDTHTNKSNEKIILGNNFRSRNQVTDVVNAIFSQIMSKDMGEIEYDKDESLVASAKYPEYEDAFAELHLINYDKNSDDDKATNEAKYIAKMIKDMINTGYLVMENDVLRPCRFSDFAILLRSKSTKAQIYIDQLKASEIPAWCETSEGYFSSYEISVMLNLLRVIDNPLKDVALLSVLMSPMFGFSADKITEIRIENKNKPLYLNLVEAASAGDIDCAMVMNSLHELRQFAVVLPADQMIQKIYEHTDFISMVEAMFDGDKSSANLKLFLSYAKQYEQTEHSGLYGFIKFIDRVIEKNDDFLSANTLSQNSDVVRIMSIHASKGLEFPICIVADCAKQFNKQDMNQKYQLNSEYGFSLKIKEAKTLKEYTSLSFDAIKLASEKETISEEMRVLYVALTRAREKLIMVMSYNNLANKIESLAAKLVSTQPISPYDIYTSACFGDWLLLSLLRHPSLHNVREYANISNVGILDFDFRVKAVINDSCCKNDSEIEQSAINDALSDPDIVSQLLNRFTFVYPHSELCTIPQKLTVTQIAKSKNANVKSLNKITPRFLSSNQLTPAQRGTALHAFMQYADFDLASKDCVSEINRLVENEFISKAQADSIDVSKIEAFFDSELYKRISVADKVLKEYKFNYEINAKDVYEDISQENACQKILIQGIADCIIIEGDFVTIIDYKTDYENSENVLAKRYEKQLMIYKDALEQELSLNVKECLIYSTHLQKHIVIST